MVEDIKGAFQLTYKVWEDEAGNTVINGEKLDDDKLYEYLRDNNLPFTSVNIESAMIIVHLRQKNA